MDSHSLIALVREVLPEERVLREPTELSSYRTENPLLGDFPLPRAVVRPAGVAELQALVRLAYRHGIPLVPVSSSAPHQKGGIACPLPHLAADLSAWKKIDLVDRRNRVCRIEPGVTYPQLLSALAPLGLTVSLPLAPRAGKSVLAAVMDREPSTWPNKQWDVSDPVCSTEILFGNGELFRTGAAGGPGSLEAQRAAGGAQKSPLGPSQTDFHRVVQGAQGSMGIVTWITIRTELRPARNEPRLLSASSLQPLLPFVYEVQRAGLGEHCFIVDAAAAALLLSRNETTRFRRLRDSLPSFLCLQNIAGFERLAAERVAYQTEDLREIAEKLGLRLEAGVGGVSAEEVLQSATTPSENGDFRRGPLGRCLSIFFLSPLDRCPALRQVFREEMEEHGVAAERLGTYLQPMVQNHFCHMEFMVPYEPAEVEVMRRLWESAVDRLCAAGAFFSRPYGPTSASVLDRNPVNREVLGKIKAIFDPGRILNPGKFGL